MNDRAICLPWDKNFEQTVAYGRLLKFTREYGDIQVCQYPLEPVLSPDPTLS